jgi:predicted nucleotidyltransferase
MINYELNQYGLRTKDMDFLNHTFRKFSVDKAVIFGSRARGNYRLGSDVDIALWGNLSSSDLKKIHFLLEYDSPTLLVFDVMLFSEVANQSLKEQILREGKTIYQRAQIHA